MKQVSLSLRPDAGPELALSLTASIDARTGRLIAAYFRVREGTVEATEEAVEGKAFADYDADGRLLGVELLAACPAGSLETLVKDEPESVRHFLHNAMPQQWCQGEQVRTTKADRAPLLSPLGGSVAENTHAEEGDHTLARD